MLETRDRRRRAIRWALVAGGVLLLLVLVAPAASAGLRGPCSGTATIDGVTYDASFDTPANPIVVPADRAGLQIPYSGEITVANTAYRGGVGVKLGPFTVPVAEWGVESNPDDRRGAQGVYRLDDRMDDIVGLYQLTAFHEADGGECRATAMILLEGNPLATAPGAGAAVGAALTLIGMVAAGIKKKLPL